MNKIGFYSNAVTNDLQDRLAERWAVPVVIRPMLFFTVIRGLKQMKMH
jgi:hypothetical protein